MKRKKRSRLVFDMEGNNLLYGITKIHCICGKDLDTKHVYKFGPDDIDRGVALLSSYDILVGHNICGFDIPAFQKLGYDIKYKRLRDTLCMSKLFDPERFDGHSLESYGRVFKRYKPEHSDWFQFSEAMLHRCSEDVEINCMLYEYLVEKYCQNWNWIKALEIEQEFCIYRAYQEIEGVDIDVDAAYSLRDKLDVEIDHLTKTLLDQLPLRVVPVGNKKTEYTNLPFKKDGNYNKATQEWINNA